MELRFSAYADALLQRKVKNPNEELLISSSCHWRKGLMVEKIHILKHGGDFLTTASGSKAFFVLIVTVFSRPKIESSMRQHTWTMNCVLSWVATSSLKVMPHLQSHLRKFLRWAEQTYMRSRPCRPSADTTGKRRPRFLLFPIINVGIFPKLLPSVRNVILRNGRESKNIQGLVATAQ